MLNDPEIRALLRPLLTDGVILEELPIGYRVGEMTRADVVHVLNGHAFGYEIKGDGDSLKRVALQLRCYARVFDKVTFVVTSKHLAKLILLLLPYPWVGIAQAREGGIDFLVRPQFHGQLCRQHLGSLLWGKELLSFLREHGVKALSKHRCHELWSQLDASGIITPVLCQHVWHCVTKRWQAKWRAQEKAALFVPNKDTIPS